MSTFSAAWNEIEKLSQQGLNIIPVRDKDDRTGKAKTPFSGWKQYQTESMVLPILFPLMEKYNTGAVAIICGAISGNLEVIDVDVKYNPGIDADLFAAIKELYPDLWHSLRIHKTPSGGYHILYKTMGQDVPGNKKIAGRYTTEDEKEKYRKLNTAKKNDLQTVNFLETRGEGGYVLAPPSLGYSIFKNNEIPTLTWEQRCALINVCASFNQIIAAPEKPKQTKSNETYYDEDPFKHFNRQCDVLELLKQYGWQYAKNKGNKIWLTRPGGKVPDVHGAIFLDSNTFYCFTTSTDFESEKLYSASSILYHIGCDRDWKKVYQHLVAQGYGKIKPKVESDLVAHGKPLPTNASTEAQQLKQAHEEHNNQVHPYGIFWEFNDKDKLIISRERLYQVAESLGYRLHDNELVRLIKPFIHHETARSFFDTLKAYIHEEDGDLYEDICNTYESFLQESGKFTVTRLPLLDANLIQEDMRSYSNKFFKNCYLQITKDAITTHDYSELQKYVFTERIQPRDYHSHTGGVYEQYLRFSLGEITPTIIETIGYLAHEYKDDSTGYIIVLTEKVSDPKKGGGSGKNLFCSLFSNTTSFISRPGAGAKFDERFFQSWNGQKIFCISDVDEHFDFLFLKEPATGGILWKKLFKDEAAVGAKNSPKLIVNTNYSYEVSDGGLARRIKPIEFTDYFTVNGGVDMVFNKHFTDDWTQEDWNGYDTFIAAAIQAWLSSNRKLITSHLSDTGWEKQFKQTYKIAVWNFITEYWLQWLEKRDVPNDLYKTQLDEFFANEGIREHYRPSPSTIHKGIYEYAAKFRVVVEINVPMRQLTGASGKGKKFLVRGKNDEKTTHENDDLPF